MGTKFLRKGQNLCWLSLAFIKDWRVVVKQALSEILIRVVFKRLINDWYGVVPTPLSDVCALTIIHHKGYTLESSAHSRSLYQLVCPYAKFIVTFICNKNTQNFVFVMYTNKTIKLYTLFDFKILCVLVFPKNRKTSSVLHN